ncbi:MAG: hypothetical protein Q9173_006041 [Seirophora scorigena]
MGSFHAQLGSYPADLSAGAHTQSYPTHAGYHSNNQQRHYLSAAQGLGSVESSSLKSQLAALQSQLAERDKDAAEARTVIGYLLKLNAHSATGGTTLFPHEPGQKEPVTPSVLLVGEVKESLAVIIDLLRDKLNTTIDDEKHPPVAYRCSENACGDLLDLSDDGPAPNPPVVERKSSALQGPLTRSAALPEPRPGIFEVQDAIENTDPISGEVPNLESDTLPLPPYVTRFGRPRTQGSCTTILEPVDHADDRSGGLPNSSSVSSCLGLAGSAQDEASESTSFTSLNSSFNSSEDETDGCAALSREEHVVGLENAKGALSTTCCEISSAGVPASPSDVDTPDPAQARTFLFTPKWSAKLSAVSASEREDAIFAHKRYALFPDLFRYGIRFRPDPTETDIYRTVLVDNLPAGVTVSALLQKIRGGAIESVKSLDTTRITGRLSALITFVHEKGARVALGYGVAPPLEFDGVKARVTLLPTPTYPMCQKLQTAITKHAHTRCLAVTNFPRTVVAPAELEHDLRVYPAMTTHRIVERKMRADGVLELEFASIDYAGWAYALLTRWQRYRGCKVSFAADPCAAGGDGRALPALSPLPPPPAAMMGGSSEMESVVARGQGRLGMDIAVAPLPVTEVAAARENKLEAACPPTDDLIGFGCPPEEEEDHTGRLNNNNNHHNRDDDNSPGIPFRRGRGFPSHGVEAPAGSCQPQ